MRYGRFDDERREYVVTRPDTPLPWINYLGSEDYFAIVSNTGAGYSFYRDARLRRLIRYRYNDAPLDVGGRFGLDLHPELRRLLGVRRLRPRRADRVHRPDRARRERPRDHVHRFEVPLPEPRRAHRCDVEHREPGPRRHAVRS